MYTATKDLLLPTTVTGSWPRPAWYTGNLYGKPFSTAMADVAFRELIGEISVRIEKIGGIARADRNDAFIPCSPI